MITRSKMLFALVLSACPLTLQAQQPSTGVPIAPSNVASANVQPESMPPAMAGGPPSGPRQPDHVARSPSMAAALKLARVIVAACRGYHVGVAILDAEGYPKLYYIPEGTAGFHAYMGFRKANTALKFGMPSGQVAAVTKADPQLAAKYQAEAANFVTFAGGMPLMTGKEVIGAVGVSGAEPSSKDEACAADGIKAVQAMLK